MDSQTAPMTFEEFVITKTDLWPTQRQMEFVRLVDDAVRGGYPLHDFGGRASGRTAILQELESWWKARYGD